MSQLESAIQEFRELLVSPLAAVAQPEARVKGHEGWTRKEILGHLIDSAANNHHRFVRAQFEPGMSIPSYQQEKWVATNQYNHRAWDHLVALWAAYNGHLLFLMEHAPKNVLANTCKVGNDEAVTLEFLMIDYVRHLKHHLDQILSR